MSMFHYAPYSIQLVVQLAYHTPCFTIVSSLFTLNFCLFLHHVKLSLPLISPLPLHLSLHVYVHLPLHYLLPLHAPWRLHCNYRLLMYLPSAFNPCPWSTLYPVLSIYSPFPLSWPHYLSTLSSLHHNSCLPLPTLHLFPSVSHPIPMHSLLPHHEAVPDTVPSCSPPLLPKDTLLISEPYPRAWRLTTPVLTPVPWAYPHIIH